MSRSKYPEINGVSGQADNPPARSSSVYLPSMEELQAYRHIQYDLPNNGPRIHEQHCNQNRHASLANEEGYDGDDEPESEEGLGDLEYDSDCTIAANEEMLGEANAVWVITHKRCSEIDVSVQAYMMT